MSIETTTLAPIENEIVSPSGGEKISHLKKVKSVPNIDEVYVYAEDNVSENTDLKEASMLVEEPAEEPEQKIDYLIYDVISGRAFSTDKKIVA